MKKYLLLFILLIVIQNNFGQNIEAENLLGKTRKNYFIENKGQWPEEVKYLARLGGMSAWITNSGVVYDYHKYVRNYNPEETIRMHRHEREDYERDNTMIYGHVIKMDLKDSNPNNEGIGKERSETYYNYFLGNDESKWASFVPLYGEVEIDEIYEGIDIRYYFDEGFLRYDYKAEAGADISRIVLEIEGADGVKINEKGELIIETSLGEVTHGKLYTYQNIEGEEEEIKCGFEKRDEGRIGINIGEYDKRRDLIIDPLIYSTFLGGNSGENGASIVIDEFGNAYVTGYTSSSDFPVTAGAFQTISAPGYYVFISKLNSTGSQLIYSTYLSGNNWDWGESIAIDDLGNAYITGWTESTNFPVTTGAFQTSYPGGWSAGFISKLNSTGSQLIYSTYLGGNFLDFGLSIAIDDLGNAYITGEAQSNNFPVTTGAFQTSYPGGWSAGFISKLNSTGSQLIYSTFLGGNIGEYGNSIAIDDLGNAYITGRTESTNFPVTTGAFQTSYPGGSTAGFISKLNSTGSQLIYSTYLGGNDLDDSYSIAIDDLGNAYITGRTESTNFPVTTGAFQTAYVGGYRGDAFISKLNSTGSQLIYSTYLGGNDSDEVNSIAIDDLGNAYITGYTESTNFPVTTGAFQTFLAGRSDVFITKLNTTGSQLVYSTYLGGNDLDYSYSIAIDSEMITYVTGETFSPNFPVTTGAFQTAYSGAYKNCFVAKIYQEPGVVKVKEEIEPKDFALNQNYPNPFNPTTKIKFTIPTSPQTPLLSKERGRGEVVRIMVYDILGREITTLLNKPLPAGTHEVEFDASGLPSGVYFYQLKTGSFAETKKMVLLR